MKAIIVGAGEVGYQIADRLSKENHDVVIIDADAQREMNIREKINALVINGNGASPKILEQAGIANADLFIAVTDVDEINLVACMIAKEYGAAFKVARVKSSEYVGDDHVLSSNKLGIDLLINPQRVVSEMICKMVSYTEATEVAEFAEGKIVFISVPITTDDERINGRSLREIKEEFGGFPFIVPAITRADTTLIPTGAEVVKKGDVISFVIKQENVSDLYVMLGMRAKAAKRVFILGGGRIGLEVARNLSRGKHEVKIIDHNKENCLQISEELDDVLVLHSNNTDVDTLKNEGVENADAYIAITDNDSANMLGSLLAKRYKAKRAIALVNDPELVNLASTLGVDACVSPRLATAGAVLKYIRGDRVLDIAMLEQNDAEVIEFAITKDFSDLGAEIKDLVLPGMIIGAIRRGKDVIIPAGNDSLLEGDHAIVFCLAATITSAEKYFV